MRNIFHKLLNKQIFFQLILWFFSVISPLHGDSSGLVVAIYKVPGCVLQTNNFFTSGLDKRENRETGERENKTT